MSFDLESMYALLPAVHRVRDAELGEPLKALLGVISEQVAALEENLDQLYDDQFIETCADWVVPYIGDALGVRAISPGDNTSTYPGLAGAGSLRAYVANTIAYRRRKGTAAVLEELARDVTGWTARAVEFFQLLATTQYLDHLRLGNTTINLGDVEGLQLINTPFDRSAHTGEVRRIASRRGRFNIPNIGIFLWRLEAYPMGRAPAQGQNERYHFSPLGADMPLFHQPVTETEITHLAEEINVPTPIRPLALLNDLKGYQDQYASLPGADRPRHSRYYGPNRSLAVYKDGTLVPPLDLVVADLSDWCRPESGKVAIDPCRGRMTFATGEEPTTLEVSYNYGFSANIGGGPYDRGRTLARQGPNTLLIKVAKDGPTKTLQAARGQWQAAGKPDCIIRIMDNAVYGGVFDLSLPAKTEVVIEAADGMRPTWRAVGNTVIAGPEGASFTLNGFLMQGALQIEGDLVVNLMHCTLVPGRLLKEDGQALNPELDSLSTATSDDAPCVTVSHSIIGPIRLGAGSGDLTISDSIVQALPVGGSPRPAIAADDAGAEPGPEAVLKRCTIFGSAHLQKLEASEVIFTDALEVHHRQAGCVRFSHVPIGSQTPPRYRCQPDAALKAYAQEKSKTLQQLTAAEVQRVAVHLRPRFTSRKYSRPAFAQLDDSCAQEIRAGGENGAEMGAFNMLMQPQREANLRGALREYLRYGLEAGILYVT